MTLSTITAPWVFPVDRDVRRRLFAPEVFSHPAKLHLRLLQRLIDLYSASGDTLLDPMAGSGSLLLAATQQRNVICRDIQPEYVGLMNLSLPRLREFAGLFAGLMDIGQGDTRTLECPPFDHIIFSPPYGFEASAAITEERKQRLIGSNDKFRRCFELNDPLTRGGFHYIGGQNNIGNKSGRNYWGEMRLAYGHLADLLPSGGLMILVLKNHYRRGKLIDITGQTVVEIENIGLDLVAQHGRLISNPSLWQRRRKEAGQPIVEIEDVLVFQK